VEHGVTELVTGLDLVGLQLLVADGHPLPLRQDEVTATGHAIEARLCAERPRQDYQPTPGAVRHVTWPESEGLRIDRAVESGSTVSPAYDSLVAKMMAHAPERPAALARLARSLRRLELDGLETNRDLLAAILADATFAGGHAGIDYLDGRDDLRQARLPDEARHRHAAAAAFVLLEARAARSLVPLPAPGWRNVGTALHVDTLSDDFGDIQVRVSAPDQPATVLVDGAWLDVGTAGAGDDNGVIDLTSSGLRRRHRVRPGPHAAYVNGPEGQSTFTRHGEDDEDEQGGTAGECRAPLPGAVTRVLVGAGDTVAEGDGLVVLEAMKMEHTLRATGPGTVSQVLVAPGEQVDVGDLLVAVDPA
jgi:propionyl-CoA carboxylase alpha chain